MTSTKRTCATNPSSAKTTATVWFWAILVGVLALSGVRSSILYRQSEAESVRQTDAITERGEFDDELVVTILPLEDSPADSARIDGLTAPDPEDVRLLAGTLGADDSIYLSLKKHGVAEMQIVLLNSAIEPVFDAKKESKPGDSYTLELGANGDILSFEYTPRLQPERPVVAEREEGQLLAQRLLLPLDRRLFAIEVDIDDNLSNSIGAAGEGDRLTDQLADVIFGSVIDFHRQPRQGDRLGLVFEKLYKDDRFVRYDRVLLAEYSGEVVSKLAIYYEDPEGNGGYYDGSGKSLERMFLLKPLSFRRISSGFSKRRFHPILKRNVPHLGTDYAASTGTEVWTTAKGRVAFAGRKGGYGKMVEVDHPNGYRTRYAHLSRIHVRKGQRVEKQQRLGLVGSSGRATGPHLHYELLRNGRHVNPVSVNRGRKGSPLNEVYLRRFAARRDDLLALVANAVPVSGTVVADRGQ